MKFLKKFFSSALLFLMLTTTVFAGTYFDPILNKLRDDYGTGGAGGGDVIGPASSIDEDIAVFDGTTGKLIKDDSLNLDRLKNLSSTALLTGGVISINADPTKFDITAGTGVVVDNHTDVNNPTYTKVAFGPFTGVSPNYLASAGATFLFIDSTGSIVQKPTISTSSENRDIFTIGTVVHPNLTTITSVSKYTAAVAYNLGLMFSDLTFATGVINISGNEYSANGANLKIDKSEGVSYYPNIDIFNDAKDPNFIIGVAGTSIVFPSSWSDGIGGWNIAINTDIIPGRYDDGTGGASQPNGIVSDHQYSIQRIYYTAGPNTTSVMYGTEVYEDLNSAISAVSQEDLEFNPALLGSPYRGALIVRGNATDLSDIEQAVFLEADKFGQHKTISGQLQAGVTNMWNFANGSITTEITSEITESAGTVYLSLERDGGGDITVQIDGNNYHFDTTPAQTVALTSGSDIAPQVNYVYLTETAGVVSMNVSTTGFPSADYASIAEVLVQSSASVAIDGPYDHHQWTNEIGNGQGHLDHVNSWIRHQPATWIDGVDPTTTITTNAASIDNVYFSSVSGNMLQLHKHPVPAKDMAISDPAFVINDFTTAYDRITDLGSIDTDSLGNTLRSNNTYYSLVLWVNQPQNNDDTKYYINVPSGSYSTEIGATDDINKYTNYSIPSEFTGTGFLVAKIILRYQTADSGTFTEIDTEDLRGLIPSTSPGGGGSISGAEFSDNLFKIFNVTDNTKEIDFDASSITTGTRRTITMQDKNLTIADNADLTSHTGAANPHSGSAASGANSDITSLSGLTTDLSIAQGGTGQSTAQTAIDALTQVSGATDEYVLTKDTASGNALWKVAGSGGLTWGDSVSGNVPDGLTLTYTSTTTAYYDKGALKINLPLNPSYSGRLAGIHVENEYNSNSGTHTGVKVVNSNRMVEQATSSVHFGNGAAFRSQNDEGDASNESVGFASFTVNSRHSINFLAGIGNTQTLSSINYKSDLGTSAQGHTGFLSEAKGASTSQRAFKSDTGSTGTGKHFEAVDNSNTVFEIGNQGGMLKVTADPCATLEEAALFYNDTSNYFCYCDGTNDVQMHSPATACF